MALLLLVFETIVGIVVGGIYLDLFPYSDNPLPKFGNSTSSRTHASNSTRSKYYSFLDQSTPLEFVWGSPKYGTRFEKLITSENKRNHTLKIEHYDGHPASNLVLFGHGSVDIAETISASLQYRAKDLDYYNLTMSQKRAVDEVDSLINRSPRWKIDNGTLEEYFSAFNDIYFFGALKNLYQLEIHEKLERHWGYHQTTGHLAESDFAGLIVVSNRTNDFTEVAGADQQIERYWGVLSTLLHEMLHAMMHSYSCRCLSCYFKWSAPHGTSWQFAAWAIERSSEDLIGRKLDLGRTRSMSHDYTTRWVPLREDSEDWDSLGLDFNLVKDDCDRYMSS